MARFSAVAPEIGPLQEGAERSRDRDCRCDHHQIIDGNTEITGIDRAVNQVRIIEGARIGAPEEAEHVLEHEQERERQKQLKALVAPVDAAQHPLDRRPDGAQQQSREDEPGKDEPGREAKLGGVGDKGDAEIRAERVERSAGQIDDLLHAEHELQAGRDQKQNGGVKHAADQDVGKPSHLSFFRLR